MVRVRPDDPGQIGLPLDAKHEVSGPALSVADVEALVARLQGAGWVSAADLAGRLGDGWSDRKVRAAARAAAPGVVSFPGSRGYKLWAACTPEEILHAIDAFESQARDMQQRAHLYQSAWHKGFRG